MFPQLRVRPAHLLPIMLGAIASLAAPGMGAADEAPPSAHNPPGVLVAKAITPGGRLVLVRYESIFIGFQGEAYNHRRRIQFPLEGVQITTVAGEKVSVEEARRRIADEETPVLVTGYKQPVPKFYRGLFAADALVFIFPRKAPEWNPIEAPGAPLR